MDVVPSEAYLYKPDDDYSHLSVNNVQSLGFAGDLHLELGRRFIYKVDGLTWEGQVET